MGESINGYDIVLKATIGGKEKLFAGTKSNSFGITPKVKESLTKENEGTSNKKIVGYDTEIGVEGVMEINAEEEKATRADRDDIIEIVKSGQPLDFAYGQHKPGNKVQRGKMVITAYSESTDAEGEATYSLSGSAITKLTPEVVPEKEV